MPPFANPPGRYLKAAADLWGLTDDHRCDYTHQNSESVLHDEAKPLRIENHGSEAHFHIALPDCIAEAVTTHNVHAWKIKCSHVCFF